MKTLGIAGCVAALLAVSTTYAQKGNYQFPKPPNANPPPKDYIVEPPPPPLATLKEPPKRAGSSAKAVLVTPEQAQSIINRFKDAYPKLGNPRLLVYVNPELIDQQPPAKKSQGETAAAAKPDKKPQVTATNAALAGEVERYFARPLRDAGASLADTKSAAQIMSGKPLDAFLGVSDSAEIQKDREALGKIADAVIEILISTRNVTVPDAAGQNLSIPEIQATAINLKDSKILGQAASADMTSRVPASALGKLGTREISEATALTLMQDMTPAQ